MRKICLILIISILFISGCSTSNQDASKTAVDDLERKVDINTKRIYTDAYPGELLYMDANLVGADLTYKSEMWPEDKLNDVEDSGGDFEIVAGMSPTLIITYNQDYVDQYSDIAPTYYIEYGKDDPIALMIRLGDLLNLEDNVANIVDDFNKRITTIKAQIDQNDLTYTIVESADNDLYLMGDNWARGGFILYNYLGLSAPQVAEDSYVHEDPTYMTIDEEQLLTYSGDVVILISASPETSLFLTSAISSQLTSVENEHVYNMDPKYAYYDDPYSVSAQLNFFEQVFSGEL